MSARKHETDRKLMANPESQAEAGSSLLFRLRNQRTAAESTRQIDRMLRSSCVGPELLAAVDDFQLFTAPSDEKSSVLDVLIVRAIQLGKARLRSFRPRSLWGVTPIIQLSSCAKADRMLGVEAETLVYTTYHITSDFDLNLKNQIDWICANAPEKLAPFQWMVFCWALLSYDIFHLYNDRGLLGNVGGYGSNRFGISLEEMQILRRAGKFFYTYTYGADHRMREATLAMGEYNLCMDCPEVGKFCLCDDTGGKTMLATIGSYATAMLATGIAMKLIPNARNLYFLAIDLAKPQFSTPRRRPDASPVLRIAHTPNHGFFKGTQRLLDAVDRLKAKGAPVELVMLSGVPNEQVLELIASCDVLADQFISGSFGYITLESMALGVPVMCYLSPEFEFLEPETLPIINCHPERIEETILELIDSKESLNLRGEQSRAYVQKHYSVEPFSQRLAGLYQDTGSWELRTTCEYKGRAPALPRLLAPLVQMRRESLAKVRSAAQNWPGALKRVACSHVAIRQRISRLKNQLGQVKQSLLRLVKRAARWTLFGSSSFVLEVAVVFGRLISALRLRFGQPRSVWGVTPILTLPLLARCDRLLGFRSESLVLTTYHITRRFDINLEPLRSKVLKHVPAALLPFEKLCLAWALLRYDVFHIFYDRGMLAPVDFRIGINPVELAVLRRSGKKMFCYAYGADVRTRDATLRLGKYNLCAACPTPMLYCICDDARAAENIQCISDYATEMISMGDMLSYVPGARNHHYWPIDIDSFPYVGVKRVAGAPLRIAHVTNHAHFKGSNYLYDAVARLQREGFAIEVMHAQGVANETVIDIYSQADVVADQFIAGFHGYAALEAMALGKPVICYLRGPEMMLDESECPIINASPEILYETLRGILESRIDIIEIGRRGRDYIEKFYSCDAVALRQGKMYSELMPEAPRLTKMLQEKMMKIQAGLERENCKKVS